MEVPKKILVDFPKDSATTNGKQQIPAGYYDSDTDDDFDDDDSAYRLRVEPTTRIMSPPQTLTATDISEEERRRFMRDTSMNAGQVGYLHDDSTYKTPNDSVLKNMNSFQSGDPVSIARQVRHLHNRVKLLEEELQTQQNRQIFLFGVLSVYILSTGFKWMFRH